MIGTFAKRPEPRIAEATAKPSLSGISMLRMTTCGVHAGSVRKAACPPNRDNRAEAFSGERSGQGFGTRAVIVDDEHGNRRRNARKRTSVP
ncbi:hypothetical protein AWB82_04192 [Caballeronia glebae]|uniref:Uncharacterized protein n=1 Tax=Caballeronia glebae TaxID=1777143 RepID=A0A158BJP6_9BURK|nr:hypothetical protein AWB82_04192 [Caballeronia glebae]